MKVSPIDAVHRALGAKMVPFGGWEMPLSYPGGTLEEHRACRRDAVVFDVSHLGTVRVRGDGARALLQRTFTNDLDKIEPGRAQYTHLLAEDGSVRDDIIVWWHDDTCFDVMPNASNTDRVLGVLDGPDVEVADITATRALLAIQGPNARERLESVAPGAAAVKRFRVSSFEVDGVACITAGTGYTGEDGVECAIPVVAAEAFWDSVVAAGCRPAGLGARDTLRLEAGLPLHGHELGEGITPAQAGLGWVVGWDKGDFIGRAALEAEREGGIARRLIGLVTEGRRPPRAGQEVLAGDRVVGEVTSGNFSPMRECGIALALCETTLTVGDAVQLRVRDRRVDATVTEPPFV